MGDPTGFLKYEVEFPEKISVQERVQNWNEFYQAFPDEKVKRQASRCMDCGVPFCQSTYGCPVENLIPEWNDLVYRGRWKEALHRLHLTNNFPEFTGRLCPAPCESACILGIHRDPVSIRVTELNIVERGFEEAWVKPLPPLKRTGKKIAIVGSGPAGLAAAQELNRMGHTVDVFEKEDRLGGLLRYGIPDFKLEKWVIDRRLQQMTEEGVNFHTHVEVGAKSFSSEKLLQEYDRVGLTIGSESPRNLVHLKGYDLNGIYQAMDYLTCQNRQNQGQGAGSGADISVDLGDGDGDGDGLSTKGVMDSRSAITAKGKRVLIIGGGDTGADCLSTALRQGALSVHQFELLPKPSFCETENEIRSECESKKSESKKSETISLQSSLSSSWPEAFKKTKESPAYEEGGIREWSILTKEFLSFFEDPQGEYEGAKAAGAAQSAKTLKAVRALRVQWENGQMKELPDSEFILPVDLVLVAIGFSGPKKTGLIDELDLKMTERGTVWTDQKFQTSHKKIFAAGDAKRGASLIVWAIQEGRKMAQSIEDSFHKL